MKILDDLQVVMETYYSNLLQVLPKVVVGIIVTFIFFKFLGSAINRFVKYMKTKADDLLLVNFIHSVLNITKYTFSALLFLFIIGQGTIASTIFGAATISSVVIGFAFKDIAENFLAGVIMAFNRPFRIGDTVQTVGVEGTITEMSLRDTHIKTFDGKDVYVPNGQIIKNPLYNYTIDGFLRKSFVIGVDFGSDIDKVRALIHGELDAIPGILNDQKQPKTMVSNLGASTIEITVQYWMNTFDKNYSGTEVHTNAMKQVLTKLEQEGINLPGNVVEIKDFRSKV